MTTTELATATAVSQRRMLLAAGGLGILVATTSVLLFGVSGRDDPYITFSAAEAIRDYGRLVNINGDPVEQSTSLLFTLLLVGASFIVPVPVPLLGWILGLAALASVVPIAYIGLRGAVGPSRALAGATVVGLTPPLVYWGASGAEQSLGVALCLASVIAIARAAGSRLSWPGVLGAALLTTLTFLARPDLGLALLGATCVLVVGLLLMRRGGVSRWWLLWVPVTQGALFGLITVLRLAVTGSPVPQPLNAKVGGGLIEQGERGFHYLLENALSPWFIALLLVGVTLAWTARVHLWSRLQTLLLLTVLVITAGVLISGGDWMELGRFFAAPAVLLAIVVMTFLGQHRRGVVVAVVVALIVLQLATVLAWSIRPGDFDSRASSVISRWSLATNGSPGVPADLDTIYNSWNADHLGDAYFLGGARPVVADLVAAHPERVLTITSGQGGMIPYDLTQQFGARLRFIDRFQLMTDDFAACDLAAGPYGSFISWNDWRNRAGACAPALPDMVYSIGPIPYDDLGDDYTVVVHVEGSAVRSGSSMPQEQWLAVRKDLLPPV